MKKATRMRKGKEGVRGQRKGEGGRKREMRKKARR